MRSLVLCGATLACAGWAQAQAPSASAVEMEFWRSAQRLGNAEAYRAYLAAFPNGVFAPLARAALSAQGAGAAGIGADSAPKNPPSNLRHFTEPTPHTGAVSFKLGDRFACTMRARARPRRAKSACRSAGSRARWTRPLPR
jgi:hypothetical protein